MLRNPASARVLALGLLGMLSVGILCGVLVRAGNPGHMGLCGACFLRDLGGALGLVPRPDLGYFRPEVFGVVAGAFLWALVRGRWQARSGSHAASRFVLGVFMGVGALVFLGCPFRMLQRLGGGDANALWGLAGFVPGVLAGLLFERRGYRAGSTAPVPAAVGLQAPALLGAIFALSLAGALVTGTAARHAPVLLSLGVGAFAGAVLSATGFCAVTAARQLAARGKGVLLGALALAAGYGLLLAATGAWTPGFEGQPVVLRDALWNALSMALVGLCGVLAGGCPVRQLVMAGEGNGDALVACAGLVLGGSLAHGLGLASPAGAAAATPQGQAAVVLGFAWALAYAFAATPSRASATTA